jgi:hypothetical protein
MPSVEDLRSDLRSDFRTEGVPGDVLVQGSTLRFLAEIGVR